MNKRCLIVLLIPMLFISIGSVAYATWSDSVTKTYNLTAGNVDIEVTHAWLKDCAWPDVLGVSWTADTVSTWTPAGVYIYPGWWAHTGMHIRNVGSLPVIFKTDALVYAYDPPETEGCFDFTNEYMWSLDGTIWYGTYAGRIAGKALPVILYPGEYLKIQQWVDFDCQELQEEAQGLTITITATITAEQAVP